MIKIVDASRSQIVVYYITTSDGAMYETDGNGNWVWVIGESTETVFGKEESELNRAFSEYKKLVGELYE